MDRNTVIEAIEKHKIIVILRGLTRDQLINTAEAMYKGGIRLAEVTYDSLGNPSDEETAANIRALAEAFPGMHIGAGTVLTERQAELTAEAGGKFIISPDTNPDVIRRTRELGLVSIPGSLTPSEATLAHRSGADFIKLFPNGEMKPSYLHAVAVPLSHLKFLAVGGVNENNLADYIRAGACGIGVATGIVNKEKIKAGDYAAITALARKYVAAAESL
ncbi:MAG: bifunctional 4-hydroxy-2-oxoglutarate aldolase/2-dehydro-3-deoxy-phosphogluconate aldolase [Clostridia bacterium]|nr:bifunctional 4-hydroxy-2-oxoglutarate aldolase/2-dehydro-3-deoxy-phosphogluconate aldolase [Clostridia bacterium]MBQ8369629.1 bifunctional 4-hydroxy-2-oxoglutarate aldolase/2-dehydro-3-deoxy-phosphogluconate aldolase [Clostridia bacterium]